MNDKLNILFLASWYPNKRYPQNGDFIQRHAIAVSKYAKVASLYVISSPDATKFTIDKKWHKGVFEVIIYYPKSPKILPFLKLQRYKKAHQIGYQEILKELERIDMVHLNVFFPAGIIAMQFKKDYGIPYIITEHWTAFLDINPIEFSAYQKWVINRTAKQANLICPVSKDLEHALVKFGMKGPFQIVPNVVDTSLFKMHATNSIGPTKILHISTLFDDHKNVSGILRTIKKLSLKRNDFTLTIIGNDYVEEQKSYARQLGLSKRIVSIQSEIPHEEVAWQMQVHDLFIMFSNYENLPCVIIEAQASGLPVLATNVGGIPEMVDEQSGILINPKDELTLYQKLNYMLDHIDQYDRKAIRKMAMEKYSYETIGKQFLKLYESVLQGNKATLTSESTNLFQ